LGLGYGWGWGDGLLVDEHLRLDGGPYLLLTTDY
jgi:hypothetical protein